MNHAMEITQERVLAPGAAPLPIPKNACAH